jgi:hypothetical protein
VYWRQFRALLWLRYRLAVNQVLRGGAANTVLLAALLTGVPLLSLAVFVLSFLAAFTSLDKSTPRDLLFVWDGVVVGFLMLWFTALAEDLRSAEALSPEKLLHLPVLPAGVFVLNYLGSLVKLWIVLFVPALPGFVLGLAFARGPATLAGLPLVAAFVFMLTALAHQFQGWIGALMASPRRRRAAIVGVTFVLMLIIQVPNLAMNFWMQRDLASHDAVREAVARDGGKLPDELRDELKEIDKVRIELERKRMEFLAHPNSLPDAEYRRRDEQFVREIQAQDAKSEQAIRRSLQGSRERAELEQARSAEQFWQQAERVARYVNLLLPPGWVALGGADAAAGDVLPALLGTIGLGLIGVVSLRRSYRTALQTYTGGGAGGRAGRVGPRAGATRGRVLLMERKLPGLSEPAAAVALSTFRSLTRAPEARMMFLSPLLLVVLFGAMLLARPIAVPEAVRPLLVFGVLVSDMLGVLQFQSNHFGFDRSGYRTLVLSAARRRDMLLGKNLAFLPQALLVGGLEVAVLQWLYPMPADLLLSVLPQALSMFLLTNLLANWLSILVPIPVAAKVVRPLNLRLVPALCRLACAPLLPLMLSPTLLPLVIGDALDSARIPVCLLVATAECVAIAFLYRAVLTWQGNVLQSREQRILEVVTARAE